MGDASCHAEHLEKQRTGNSNKGIHSKHFWHLCTSAGNLKIYITNCYDLADRNCKLSQE